MRIRGDLSVKSIRHHKPIIPKLDIRPKHVGSLGLNCGSLTSCTVDHGSSHFESTHTLPGKVLPRLNPEKSILRVKKLPKGNLEKFKMTRIYKDFKKLKNVYISSS